MARYCGVLRVLRDERRQRLHVRLVLFDLQDRGVGRLVDDDVHVELRHVVRRDLLLHRRVAERDLLDHLLVLLWRDLLHGCRSCAICALCCSAAFLSSAGAASAPAAADSALAKGTSCPTSFALGASHGLIDGDEAETGLPRRR
jgi:hypothetical protein